MRPLLVAGIGLLSLLLAGCSGGEPSPRADYPSLGGGPRDRTTGPHRFASLNARRLSYVCPDGRGFGLQLTGVDENGAVFQDRTNSLLFNLRRLPSTQGTLYSDGTIFAELNGVAGNVVVSGSTYMADCELRTRDYACAGGNSFILDSRAVDESETVFWDGTNGKYFTLYEEPGSNATKYGDGAIFVDLSASAGVVYVGGTVYFADCRIVDPAF